MWKKDDTDQPKQVEPSPAPPRTAMRSDPVRKSEDGERAMIGPSIVIRGDVTGEEDLFIQGQIEGTVDLRQHHVVIGKEGKLKAEIHGRSVTIEGEVEGDVHAEEQVILRPSAKVQGNLVSPRVILEDGATFKGGIDMEVPLSKPGKSASPIPASQVKAQRADPPKAAGEASSSAADAAKTTHPKGPG